MNKQQLLFKLRIKRNPLENLVHPNKIREYIIDEYPDENRDKNYICFLIISGEVVYVGQANNGFYRRIKEHKRHLEFYNYVILELNDNDNVNDVEYFWINKCNPILNGILTPWEKYHCKSKMGFNGTVNDVLNYIKTYGVHRDELQ